MPHLQSSLQRKGVLFMGQCSTITKKSNGVTDFYEIEIQQPALKKRKTITGDTADYTRQKALVELAKWDTQCAVRDFADRAWARRQQKATTMNEHMIVAAEKTRDTRKHIKKLNNLLADALTSPSLDIWNQYHIGNLYPPPKPIKPITPEKPKGPQIPNEPKIDTYIKEVKAGFFTMLIPSKRRALENTRALKYEHDLTLWKKLRQVRINKANDAIRAYNLQLTNSEANYLKEVEQWDLRRHAYLAQKERGNAQMNDHQERYFAHDPVAIEEYCSLILTASDYPDYFPQSACFKYIPESKLLIIDYHLCPPHLLPNTSEIRYAPAQHELIEMKMSIQLRNDLFDHICYQTTIRSIFEIFQHDQIDAVRSIIFNGYVTGQGPHEPVSAQRCILSIHANEEAFMKLDLQDISPKIAYKKMGGNIDGNLYNLHPITGKNELDIQPPVNT